MRARRSQQLIISRMNSKIRAEIQSYTANEQTCRKLMNFYRCSKTISFLSSLYYSLAINKTVYAEELEDVQEVYNNLREQLKDYDLKRFCELWEIDFHEKVEVAKRTDVPLCIARIANSLPRINDAIYTAESYKDIYEVLASFCQLIQEMKSLQYISPAILGAIEDLTRTEKTLQAQYKNLGERLQDSQKETLTELLTRFRVEFQRIYNL